MRIPIYQLDAFSDRLFGGNPAAVCPLEAWLPDARMQAIAAENNLSETAFIVREGDGYALRWFTPTLEVDLCGHATLATAHVVFERLQPGTTSVRFRTRVAGELGVTKQGEWLELDFPTRPSTICDPPAGLEAALGIRAREVRRSMRDLVVVLASEAEVTALAPRMDALAALGPLGIIVTARGATVDFVSRFFAPGMGIDEDPVTGSAHCVLTPYWSGVLGKTTLAARQVSKRGGVLRCALRGERVGIAGRVVPYMEGVLELE